MPFWTVEDAGPYKERLNFLMRRSLLQVDIYLPLGLCNMHKNAEGVCGLLKMKLLWMECLTNRWVFDIITLLCYAHNIVIILGDI